MGTLVIAKDWDGLDLQASSAFIDHKLFERFDAGKVGETPRLLDQYNATRMFVSETRLSRPFHYGLGWVVGASLFDNRTRQRRDTGEARFQATRTGVTTEAPELHAHGEATEGIHTTTVAEGKKGVER